MIDKSRVYCFSGALAPFLIGYSATAIKEGALPLGLIVGGVAVITTPFVLKYLTPFALQYAEMLSCYFYPPANPPGGSSPLIISTPEGTDEKIQAVVEEILVTEGRGQTEVGEIESLIPVDIFEQTPDNSPGGNFKELKRTPERRRSFQINGRQSLGGESNIPSSLGIRAHSSLQSLDGLQGLEKDLLNESTKRQSLGGKRFSIGSVGYGTPPSGPSASTSGTHTPVPILEEGTEGYIKYLSGLPRNWQKMDVNLIDPYELFYLNLSLGTAVLLKEGTKLVKGIPNTSVNHFGVSRAVDNSHIISALQAVCHNKYFSTQLKVLKNNPSSLSLDQKKLVEMLESLFRSFNGTSKIDQMTYKMNRIKEITEKIDGKASNDAVDFIGKLFSDLNINNFTLLIPDSEGAFSKEYQTLQVPVVEDTLAKNIELFFSDQISLQGQLPDLFTIELQRENEYGNRTTKEIDVEEEIDFSPYLEKSIEGKSLYKITAAICYLKENSDWDDLDGRYVTFVRSEEKWLLCDDDEILEVSNPYLKGAQAFVFEKVD